MDTHEGTQPVEPDPAEADRTGTAEGEDQVLREEDVTRADGLNDDVREGEEGELPAE